MKARATLLHRFLTAEEREASAADPSTRICLDTEQAHDALMEWKEEHAECVVARCTVTTLEHAYCLEHR